MKPEQQRIAIAEACGWRVDPVDSLWNLTYPSGTIETYTTEGWCLHRIPDYLNSLDAMHEAEKVLDADKQIQYANLLTEIVKSRHWAHAPFDCIHATAPQRAEAFLRTINKWTNEPEGERV